MSALTVFTAWLLAVASAHPLLSPKSSCRPFSKGSINIASYQLYPENVDFDEQSYIGSLYNASVVVYDPYKASVVETIEFPNITRTVPFHIGGIAWDPYAGKNKNSKNGANKPTDEITILVDAAPAHETAGRDVSGDNYIIRWSATSHRVLWTANLTAVSRGRYGGPQDVEHDGRGNIYVLGTYPGTLLRLSPDGRAVDEWYVPPPSPAAGNATAAIDHAVLGYTGFAAADEDTLLVADARNGSAAGGALYRFDMAAAKGVPTPVPIAYPGAEGPSAPQEAIRPGDAVYLPPRYGNSVLLIAEHGAGVSVLRSRGERGGSSKWRSAEFLGRIPNPADVTASGGLVTAAVEIAGSVFMVEEWFTDPLVPGTSAGNRTSFPLVDITAELDVLVRPR
ncbi:hypothetical protein GGS24DRAFT_512702 [Hypoxylon argillaceum]|nr:hypothetical protein GGS24DRAFT_512702 [Hypoxylon argillaceum]